MQPALIKKLQELNHTYRTDCKVKFIDSDYSYYHKGVITLGLESPDPLWTLCHEFKHFLQDSKKNYLYLLKHKIFKRTILYSLLVVLVYYVIVKLLTGSVGDEQIGIMVYLFIFGLLIYPPLINKTKELYKDLNHHLEFEADRFATKHSGMIPYHSQLIDDDEESISHPSWNSRIMNLESEFPNLKIIS